jgi:RNA polymerase sigma factor (sigma-70 family)
MQPISTEELVAYLAKKLPSDRAQAIDDLSDRDAEVAARLWLIQATAGYCREDVRSTNPPAAEKIHIERLERVQEAPGAPEPACEPSSSTGSVSRLVGRVKEGDQTAARELYARYRGRLLGLARARIRGKDLRVADEEDAVNSALAGFFAGAERGQYPELRDRDDLWHLLFKITVRKALKLVNEQKRQKRIRRTEQHGARSSSVGDTQPEDAPIEQIADAQPSPDLEVLANETMERLLDRLRAPQLRSIAVWKWEGHTNEEIATMLGCSARTIQRKLRLIRAIWSEEDGAGTCQAS